MSNTQDAETEPGARNGPLLGAHMQTTGGLHQALLSGKAIGCDTVQLFTSTPQQWKARPLSEEQISLFKAAHQETGLHPLVVHDSYLINLASPDGELREKSRLAFLEQMDRCEALGIHFLVTHCGASCAGTEDEGLTALAESLSSIHSSTSGYHVRITLEVTAGQGTCLGHRFEHLARVMGACVEGDRLSICLDTCHAFAAGYDIRTAETYEATMEEFSRIIGLEKLAVIHANDSVKEMGSRVDRHAHIGKGHLGAEAFRLLLRDPRLEHVPKIVETPDFNLHEENIQFMRRLAQCAEPILPESSAAVGAVDGEAGGKSAPAAKPRKRSSGVRGRKNTREQSVDPAAGMVAAAPESDPGTPAPSAGAAAPATLE